jgi:hypothetical protein
MMITGMMLFGCEAPEQPSEKKLSVKAEEEKEPADNAITVPAIVAAKAVADKSLERAEQMDEIVEAATKDIEEVSSTTVQEPLEEVKTAPIVIEEQTVAVVVAKEEIAEATVTAETDLGPKEINLTASYGDVLFPHNLHAEAYDCALCHGSGTPGAFELTKAVAHPLCKDCHKAEGAGPTGCRDCHVK